MKTITIPHPAVGPLTVTCHPAAADDLLARSQLPDWSVERYGEWTVDWYEGWYRIAGRTGTLLEMHAHAAYKREQAKLKRDREGCCGEMMSQGECWGCGGMCPIYEATKQAAAILEQLGSLTTDDFLSLGAIDCFDFESVEVEPYGD